MCLWCCTTALKVCGAAKKTPTTTTKKEKIRHVFLSDGKKNIPKKAPLKFTEAPDLYEHKVNE